MRTCRSAGAARLQLFLDIESALWALGWALGWGLGCAAMVWALSWAPGGSAAASWQGNAAREQSRLVLGLRSVASRLESLCWVCGFDGSAERLQMHMAK